MGSCMVSPMEVEMSENVLSPSLLARYLSELEKDEEGIAEAAEAYESAKAQMEMGLRRYAALRDFVVEQFGRSPYATDVDWPNEDWHEGDVYGRPKGIYRFAGLKVADAIRQALDEQQHSATAQYQWLTLDELVEKLSEGGLGYPEPVQARAVNAALQGLIRSGAVAETIHPFKGQTVYAWDDPENDGRRDPPEWDDDLPF